MKSYRLRFLDLHVRPTLFLLALACALTAGFPASAQDTRTRRVKFAAGQTEAVVTDKIAGRQSVVYKLNARDGQFLQVSLRPDNQAADFNIYIPGRGPGDEALFTSATGGREYVGQLYKTGDHSVSVFLNRAAARRGETANYDIVFSITGEAPTHPIYDDEISSSSMVSGYELGKTKGYQDGQAGLSRTPTRHEISYSEANRAEFFRGYEDGYNQGIKPGAPAPASFGEPFTAVIGEGTVTIKEGNRTVAVCKTASPNIEQTRFIEEQSKIVVMSRGNHGPATVELFNAHTGRREGSVKAYELKSGGPSWATGMGD